MRQIRSNSELEKNVAIHPFPRSQEAHGNLDAASETGVDGLPGGGLRRLDQVEAVVVLPLNLCLPNELSRSAVTFFKPEAALLADATLCIRNNTTKR